MPQLRWTLLLLGVLFVVLLWWLERRSQREKFRGDRGSIEKEPTIEPQAVGTPVFREPNLTLPEMRAREPSAPQELPVVEIEDDSLNARRIETHQPLMDPPTLSLPVLESGPVRRERVEPSVSGTQWITPAKEFDVPRLDTPARQSPVNRIDLADTGEAEQAFNDEVFGGGGNPNLDLAGESTVPDVVAVADLNLGTPETSDPGEDPSSEETAPEPEEPAGARFTAADVTPIVEPIVDWPPDDQRRVVALRLVAPPPDRLPGRALRLALASEGFVLGKFQIFHKPDSNGRAVLSAANLSKPGTFDLGTMDVQRFGGLSLFAVLPGPKPPLKAFEDLLTTARNLNERLQGALQDERGGPLTPTRIATLRDALSGTEAAS